MIEWCAFSGSRTTTLLGKPFVNIRTPLLCIYVLLPFRFSIENRIDWKEFCFGAGKRLRHDVFNQGCFIFNVGVNLL
jgi:hypothetical protein